MLLYFLRHGDTLQNSHIDDNKRPLTDLGVHQATLVGIYLQRINVKIDILLSSPLERAQQTASIIQEIISTQPSALSEFLLNGVDQQQLFEQLDRLKGSSALLVGHEPHLSETISLLVCGNRETGIEMKKCSLALIDIPLPIRQGHGQLRWLINLDVMQKLIQENH